MEFSKQLMTITELHEQNGIPIRVLRKLVHAKGAPVIRPGSGRNAMYYIDTTKLEKFLKKSAPPAK